MSFTDLTLLCIHIMYSCVPCIMYCTMILQKWHAIWHVVYKWYESYFMFTAASLDNVDSFEDV